MDDAVGHEGAQTLRHRFIRHIVSGQQIAFGPLCGINLPILNMFAFSNFHLLNIAELVFELILRLEKQLHVVKPSRTFRGMHDRTEIHRICVIWNDACHFNLLPIECARIEPRVFRITSHIARRPDMRIKSCAVLTSFDVFTLHPATHDITAARLDGERPPELNPRWISAFQHRRHDGFASRMRDRVRTRVDMLIVRQSGTPARRRDFVAVFKGVAERLQRRAKLVGQIPCRRIVPIEPQRDGLPRIRLHWNDDTTILRQCISFRMNGIHKLHAVVIHKTDVFRRRSRQAKISYGNEQHVAVRSRVAFVGDDDCPPLPMRDIMV